jgi:hypothetical protein
MLWLVLGLLIGAVFVFMLLRPEIKLAWFDWVLLVVAVVFFLLAIANYTGSMQELEPTAAWFLLASFGIPGLILAAIVAVRVIRNRPTA